jgi:quercetin dioxygenase-like cupin family protein
MQVIPSGEMDAKQGDESHFSGTVWQVVLCKIEPPSGMNIYSVLFAPNARTAWHSHPGGQILYVTSGKGRIVCLEGSRAQPFEIRPGDIVHIAPSEVHWHGAAPDNFLIHTAITPHPAGESTNWEQKVSDAEYKIGGWAFGWQD